MRPVIRFFLTCCLCLLGGLLYASMPAGNAPRPVPSYDAPTAAELLKPAIRAPHQRSAPEYQQLVATEDEDEDSEDDGPAFKKCLAAATIAPAFVFQANRIAPATGPDNFPQWARPSCPRLTGRRYLLCRSLRI